MKQKSVSATAVDGSAEQKIKSAARIIFHKKGFAATRTRDIAAEAGINLALLNYYFRSKENLFNIIMLESLQGFFASLKSVLNDEITSFEIKIEMLVLGYIEMLSMHPELPLFILSELRNNPDTLIHKSGMKEIVLNSYFMKQFQLGKLDGKYTDIHPLHVIMNLIGMTVFPFAASPVIKGMGNLDQKQFLELMHERKKLIPLWMNSLIKAR